jgi:hypothetical protein
MPMTRKTMLAVFLLAQLADILTTNAALGLGAWEGNPMMAVAQASMGGFWFIPKLAIVALLLWQLSRTTKPRLAAFAAALSVVGPLNNALTLLYGV